MYAKIALDTTSYEKGVDGAKKSSADLQVEIKNLGMQMANASKESNSASERLEELENAANGAAEGTEDVAKSGKKLSDIFKNASKVSSGFSSKLESLEKVASKIGEGLATAAKVSTAAITAATTAVATLTKTAVSSYADYEQLVGGIETLFGAGGKSLEEYAASVGQSTEEASAKYDALMQAQQIMLDNTSKAYETAGLSANDYMETVTGFSAALVSSLGGDTVKAAEYADMALTDMADNANKMGTDMESIQNAYQGFAKQNYTMLDNLKLGYGGTKEEMERLLAEAQKISGVKYDISSYADIVDAIHVVQTEMGITGTTAREAASTISGSISMMKASWSNLVTALASDNLPVDDYADAFAESVETVADNVLPRIDIVLSSIVKLISALVPKIIEKIPGLLDTLTPDLFEAAKSILSTLSSALLDNFDFILDSALQIIIMLANGLRSALPKIADAACEIVEKLGNWIAENADVLSETAVNLVATLAKTIVTKIPVLIKNVALAVAKALPALVESFSKAIFELDTSMGEATRSYYDFSEAQLEIIESAEDTREKLEEMNAAFEEAASAIDTDSKKTEELWGELQALTDEAGYVTDANKNRARFILGELNEALGTEYELNGNIIEQYQQMQDEVDALIKQQSARRLLEAGEETYQTNIQALESLERDLYVKQQAYNSIKNQIDSYQDDLAAGWQGIYEYVANRTTARYNGDLTISEEFERRMAEHGYSAGTFSYDDITAYKTAATVFAEMFNVSPTDFAEYSSVLDGVKAWLDQPAFQAKTEYEQALAAVNAVRGDIVTYEKAQEAFYTGDYDTTASLLDSDRSIEWQALVNGSTVEDETLQNLRDDLDYRRFQLENYAEQLTAGTFGYTQSEYDAMMDTFTGLVETWEAASGESYDTLKKIAQDVSKDDFKGFLNKGITFDTADRLPVSNASTTSETGTSPDVNVSITINADTDDLGDRIARELQDVLDDLLFARGNLYRNGRTIYAQ